MILYFQSSYKPNWIDHFNGTVSSIQAASQLNLTISLTDLPRPTPHSPRKQTKYLNAWNSQAVFTSCTHGLNDEIGPMPLLSSSIVQKSLPDMWGVGGGPLQPTFLQKRKKSQLRVNRSSTQRMPWPQALRTRDPDSEMLAYMLPRCTLSHRHLPTQPIIAPYMRLHAYLNLAL